MLQRNKLFGLGASAQSQIQATKQLETNEKSKGFSSIREVKKLTSTVTTKFVNKEELKGEDVGGENSQSAIMKESKNSNTQNNDKFSDVDSFLEVQKWQESSIGEHSKEEPRKSNKPPLFPKINELPHEYKAHLITLQDKLKEAKRKNDNLLKAKNTLQRECTYSYNSLVFKEQEDELLKQHNDSVKEVKDEHERLICKIRSGHENIVKLIEADIKEELNLIRKSQAQEKDIIEGMHQRELETIQQQHKEQLKKLNKKILYNKSLDQGWFPVKNVFVKAGIIM
jgi:hypothetical protein